MTLFKNRWDKSALLLLLATATAFGISNNHTLGLYAGASALLIAYLKGRLVVLDFMELRHAPLLWRALLEVWLLLLTTLLLAVYFSG